MNFPGFIRDITGRYVIGATFDGECSAPTVTDTHTGSVAGVYLDDSTPDLESWIAKAVAAYPNGIVLVGVPPGRPKLRHKPAPPVVNLQEWYPYHSGFPVSDWGEMPTCEGYILQNRFWGFQGTRRPDWFRRRSLIRQAQAHSPKYIFLY